MATEPFFKLSTSDYSAAGFSAELSSVFSAAGFLAGAFFSAAFFSVGSALSSSVAAGAAFFLAASLRSAAGLSALSGLPRPSPSLPAPGVLSPGRVSLRAGAASLPAALSPTFSAFSAAGGPSRWSGPSLVFALRGRGLLLGFALLLDVGHHLRGRGILGFLRQGLLFGDVLQAPGVGLARPKGQGQRG